MMRIFDILEVCFLYGLSKLCSRSLALTGGCKLSKFFPSAKQRAKRKLCTQLKCFDSLGDLIPKFVE